MKTGLSTITKILSLLILAAAVFAVFSVFSFSSQLKEKTEITVYLKNFADSAALQEEIAGIKEIKKVSFISKEEALKAFKRDMGKDEDIFSILQSNPLPDSFRIRINSKFATIDEFDRICAKLRDLPGVSEARYEKEFLTRLLRILGIVEIAGLTIGGIVAGFALLVFFTIKKLTGVK
jgi:cell division transport system permease protein